MTYAYIPRHPGSASGSQMCGHCWLQGDLTDPSYFDFISFAQLATISREIPKGQQEFEVRDGRTDLFGSSATHPDM